MQTAVKQNTVTPDMIRDAIRTKVSAAVFKSWIEPLGLEISNSTLTCVAQNMFSADVIRGAYMGEISAAAASFGLGVAIVVRGAAHVARVNANDNRAATYAPAARPVDAMPAFDAFIATDENQFVLSACKKMAAGAASFSPLFIYGPSGCGKSLLAACIASAPRTIMMTGGQFVAEFARSLHDKCVFAFKDFCRKCDTFIIDDVQALAGKRATMDEFVQLIMDLRNAGKNIVLTANVAPNNLTGFDRRAQSLMASGLVADIVAPTRDVRAQMLRDAGAARDVADMVAAQIAADGHLVSGVATKIRAYSELMGTSVDMNVASRLLSDVVTTTRTPAQMVRAMCEKLGVSYDAVCGAGRTRGLVLARQMMCAALKTATDMSLSEIGRVVGGRDHATVLYAINQIEKMKQRDLMLAAQIDQLVASC